MRYHPGVGLKTRGALPIFRLTPEVVLRPCRLGDAEALFEVIDANREHLRQWLPWLDLNPTSAANTAFLRDTARQHRAGTALRMIIDDRGAIAGIAALENIDRTHRHAKIGYWLAAAHQGRGFMTRAVRALCDHGFGAMGLHRIEIRAAPGNRRSRAVPERLGFTREGQQRQVEWLYDHFVDLVIYGMLATEWNRE